VDGGWNFLVLNCTCGRFHTVTFETVSCFFPYIYLRIPSYLGLRGEPPFFQTFFFAVPSNAFIRIHISGIRQCGFCTNSYNIIHTIVIEIVKYEFVHDVVFVPIHTFFI